MNSAIAVNGSPSSIEKSGPLWLRGLFFLLAGVTATAAPWMLGGETVRTQEWLFAGSIATAGLGFALWRCRSKAVDGGPGRLLVSALVLGALFLLLLGVQALNPSHRVILENRLWRLEPLAPVEWAPKSLAAPFAEIPGDGLPFHNTPRYLLIFGTVWLYAVGLALGLTAERTARRLVLWLGLNAVALAAVCIVHVATHSSLTLWRYQGTFDFSHSPVFFYKNHNGAFLAASLAVVLGLAISAEGRWARRGWEIAAALIWTGTLLVDSRVATAIATVLGVIFLALRTRRERASDRSRWRWRGVALTLISVVALLFTLRDTSAVKRFTPFLEDPADFIQGGEFRVMLRSVGVAMWQDRPVWGWGGGSFLYLFNTYHQKVPALGELIYRQQPTLNRFYWPTANCDWVEFAVEYGSVGLLLIAGMALLPFLQWCHFNRNRSLGGFLMAAVAALAVHGFFDYVLRNPAILILGVSCGISALGLKNQRSLVDTAGSQATAGESKAIL